MLAYGTREDVGRILNVLNRNRTTTSPQLPRASNRTILTRARYGLDRRNRGYFFLSSRLVLRGWLILSVVHVICEGQKRGIPCYFLGLSACYARVCLWSVLLPKTMLSSLFFLLLIFSHSKCSQVKDSRTCRFLSASGKEYAVSVT